MSDCFTCSEGPELEFDRCPSSQRPCGHHCNCIWVHDGCHWCGGEIDDDGQDLVLPNGTRLKQEPV